ncbi:rhodanese-like domain-containing protein [Thiofilum flexile]|uniref:rhodanese-like domain-containing protein n=1 Tax=Thiofilum flexile TaxID=125627 RepID=UPI00036C0FB5|nr:rhodanese-like domain-containing protein [Thiofilum flexile]
MSDLIHLQPQAAYEFLQTTSTSLLIDIRSSMEYLFVGHAIGSVHIPWIDEPDWVVDPNFAQIVEKTLASRFKETSPKQDTHVILICRSGKRTLDAADALLKSGFEHVYHVEEGFEGEKDEQNHRSTVGGWRFHGLPWEQC